ncbi:MAG: Arc family DNA-binding protein [Betaproteobacteria bacterium]|nr:Arc family DNA-binding protein [Betaproteobacteria bacterium]
MSVNLSIKNVPDALAEKLRQRAFANHRSLQGELMALLEANLRTDTAEGPAPKAAEKSTLSQRLFDGADQGKHTLAEISAKLRKVLPAVKKLPPGTFAVEIVRLARDMRDGDQWKDPTHHEKGY